MCWLPALIAEGCLAIIIRITRVSPVVILNCNEEKSVGSSLGPGGCFQAFLAHISCIIINRLKLAQNKYKLHGVRGHHIHILVMLE